MSPEMDLDPNKYGSGQKIITKINVSFFCGSKFNLSGSKAMDTSYI